MFDERGMLTDRARGILFWFTIGMIAIVAILAILFIFSRCSRLLSQPTEASLVIAPAEKELCIGQQHQFTFEGDDQVVMWTVTGGTITQSGLYTAEVGAGDYTITIEGRDSKQKATAVVHVVACTPTDTPVPTIVPTNTPLPEPTAPVLDPQGDVKDYTTRVVATGVPGGLDIKSGSVQADLRVTLQPTEEVPEELAGWAAEGEALMWISFYEPIPDPPGGLRWFFVLDLDGNASTGRPQGTYDIDTGLGNEVAVVIDAGGTISVLVWDNASASFVEGPAGARFTISESRTVVALALPLNALTQAVTLRTGVTMVPDAVKGRVAADAFLGGTQRVIDYFPDP
jgi:hypothetical protein